MNYIYTLRDDIYAYLRETPDWQSKVTVAPHFSGWSARPSLRMSQLGDRCPRALWNSIHHPELAEPTQPWVQIKYAYGHMVEALAIALAKAAGHEVVGEQDELKLCEISGHRDCVIDGCVVDVKSSTSYGLDKLKNKTLAAEDTFGYLDQLDAYIVASADDPLVRVKDKGYILGVDRSQGHMEIYEHVVRPRRIVERCEAYKHIVAASHTPQCTCSTKPEGASGNMGLDVPASYSAYKWDCFPTLRCFLYASGPVYLTHVVRRPAAHIIEVDKHGKIVYN